MGAFKILLVCFLVSMLCACSAYIHTSWKAPGVAQKRYAKILVVGIINEVDTTLRQQVENYAIHELRKLGYEAVSALEEYGPTGLASISQEQTFLTLNNDGIDALITIVLLDKAKEKQNNLSVNKHASALYYYNRIWNYNKMEAAISATRNTNAQYFWEGILFDLKTLDAQYAAQTKHFDAAELQDKGASYANAMVHNMVKKRVLTNQRRYAVRPAF